MDFKVIFRETFIEDLEHVVRAIASSNPSAARKLGESIIATGETLSFFPERYPRVRQRPGLRRFIVAKHFKVFYRVDHHSGMVEVFRCWDGRRGIEPRMAGLGS
jgi:plasmid stabilization system protein ParE